MERGWYSVEQVAERLGLHVRTVRGYIRDGRLKAVRIGKQYRIAQPDLDAFTGRPTDAGRLTVEVSTVVEFNGIGARAADRLSTLLVAGAQLPWDAPEHLRMEPLRVQTVYDNARARLKIIILGGVAATAEVLQTIDDVTGSGGVLSADTAVAVPDAPAVAGTPEMETGMFLIDRTSSVPEGPAAHRG